MAASVLSIFMKSEAAALFTGPGKMEEKEKPAESDSLAVEKKSSRKFDSTPHK